MMMYFFDAAFPTLGVMGYEIFIKKMNRNPLTYILLFFILTFCNYFIQNSLHGADYNVYSCQLTPEQRDHIFWKIHHHYMEAGMLSRNAESWVETLKSKLDKNEYHLSTAAIVAISTAACTKSLHAGAVSACILFLEKYLSDFKQTWNELRICLIRAEYHVELAEFYQDLLATDGG